MAAALGVADDDEWEARDALVRDVLRAGRRHRRRSSRRCSRRRRPRPPGAAPDAAAIRAADAGRGARVGAARRTGWRRWSTRSRPGEDGARAIEIAAAHGAMDAVLPALVRCCAARRSATLPPVPGRRAPAADGRGGRRRSSAGRTVPAGARAAPGDDCPRAAAGRLPPRRRQGRPRLARRGRRGGRRSGARPIWARPRSFETTSLFLVREHLLLADTATRRDISEEEVVLRVARAVGDRRRLAMLSVLTLGRRGGHRAGGVVVVAPGAGPQTSSSASSGRSNAGWFARRTSTSSRAPSGRSATRSTGWPSRTRSTRSCGRCPPGTCGGPIPADAAGDLGLVLPRPAEGEVRVAVAPGRATRRRPAPPGRRRPGPARPAGGHRRRVHRRGALDPVRADLHHVGRRGAGRVHGPGNVRGGGARRALGAPAGDADRGDAGETDVAGGGRGAAPPRAGAGRRGPADRPVRPRRVRLPHRDRGGRGRPPRPAVRPGERALRPCRSTSTSPGSPRTATGSWTSST